MKSLKQIILTLSAVAVAVSLNSCDSKKKIAEKIEGTWATEKPEYISVPGALDATSTTFMQFMVEPMVVDPLGGSVLITANFEASYVAPKSDLVVQPYSITPSGIVSVEGQWYVKDDDEIMINLNPSTFTVKVDPETVVLNDNVLTGENFSTIDSIKPILLSQVENGISGIYKTKLLNIREMDDVKIGDYKLKCEINDVEYHFMRQAEPVEAK